MKAVIVYDSFFFNTKKIAEAIGSGFLEGYDVHILPIAAVAKIQLLEVDLLIIGSPTRGFRPTRPISRWLKDLPSNALKHAHTVAFDTRIDLKTIKSGTLRFIVDLGGYAAQHIEQLLIKKGGTMLVPPEGFFVTGEQGPLGDEELNRARIWGKAIQGLCLSMKPKPLDG